MKQVRTTCPYCGVGCGIVATRDDDGVTVAGDPLHPANFGLLCSKGAALAETLDLEGRLLQPVVNGKPASWDAALERVASEFGNAIARHGPDSVAFYVSGQLLTEDYYVANKLMKGYIGSANIDSNSRLCMASAVVGHKRAFGADFVPCSYADLEAADLIVTVGANVAWCHPVLYRRIRQAKAERPDLKLVVIDPRRTPTCDLADIHLALEPGTDTALFCGLLTYLHRTGSLDGPFIDRCTEGFGDTIARARAAAGSIAQVAAECGLEKDDVTAFFRLFASTDRTVTAFSQGVNQSSSGSDKVNSIINVHLATGRIGRPGTGPFSLTGQPNAMGGREVGALANTLAAHMDFEPENVDRVGRFWGSSAVASTPGLQAVDLFDAVHDGKVKAIWIMSTNPVVSLPGSDRVREALERCPFVVVSDCMHHTDTTACADVLLPAATWGEKSGTVTNSERRISRQRAFLDPPGMSRPDWKIVCDVAARMGFGEAFDFQGPAEIFREHARLSEYENSGTRDFDIGSLAELTVGDYREFVPNRWPLARAGDQVAPGPDRGSYFTPTGRARFVPVVPSPPAEEVCEKFPLLLMTGRLRDQWHTMTRSGKSPRLAQTDAEPRVHVHPADAVAIGTVAGGFAEVSSAGGSVLMRVEVTDSVRRGELFMPMHWSRQFARRARVGALIGSHVDPFSGQPELKATPVTIRPVAAAWHGFILSRSEINVTPAMYWARSRGSGYWRYELAGDARPSGWPAWAKSLLGEGDDWVEFHDAAAGRYRGAKVEDGHLAGCVFVNTGGELPDRSWLGTLFEAASIDGTARAGLLTARPSDAAAESGPPVCACFGVGRRTLEAAIRTRRLTSVEEIGKALSAGTNCGSCVPELNGLILAAQQPAVPQQPAALVTPG